MVSCSYRTLPAPEPSPANPDFRIPYSPLSTHEPTPPGCRPLAAHPFLPPLHSQRRPPSHNSIRAHIQARKEGSPSMGLIMVLLGGALIVAPAFLHFPVLSGLI